METITSRVNTKWNILTLSVILKTQYNGEREKLHYKPRLLIKIRHEKKKWLRWAVCPSGKVRSELIDVSDILNFTLFNLKRNTGPGHNHPTLDLCHILCWTATKSIHLYEFWWKWREQEVVWSLWIIFSVKISLFEGWAWQILWLPYNKNFKSKKLVHISIFVVAQARVTPDNLEAQFMLLHPKKLKNALYGIGRSETESARDPGKHNISYD